MQRRLGCRHAHNRNCNPSCSRLSHPQPSRTPPVHVRRLQVALNKARGARLDHVREGRVLVRADLQPVPAVLGVRVRIVGPAA
jgi:hypothetical protein